MQSKASYTDWDIEMKKPLTITFFEVGDVYTEDGMGPWTCKARFSNRSVAETFAKNAGNYGHKAGIREVTITICDTIEQVKIAEEEAARAFALSKLTKEERWLLGL
jgi:hypothetical protein